MGYARILSRGERGLDAPQVAVEVQLTGGLPAFNIVGLAETAVRESRDRVRGALASAGFDFPVSRIVVNLAPADLPKHGGRYDLAIALGILAASRQLRSDQLDAMECFAELTLSGDLAPVAGVLPSAMAAAASQRAVIVAPPDAATAALAPGARAYAAPKLVDAVAHLSGTGTRLRRAAAPASRDGKNTGPDLADVRGQAAAKRALVIAAAGAHNLLMIGPPGSGKSMLAMRLPALLPPLGDAEALEVAAIRSLTGDLRDDDDWRRRPFRAPHHGASAPALVGGGSRPRPGEISRAHRGVLFLDELPEFSRHVLEMLREPMETGTVHIARARQQVRFPAQFQLVAAMNPCPCGYLGDPERACRCSQEQVQRYRGRLSGPLLDRIDLGVTLSRVPFGALSDACGESETPAAAQRVVRARRRRRQRLGDGAAADTLGPPSMAALDGEALALLERAVERLHLSARACHRVLRVARTIADLGDRDGIAAGHVAEALSLRPSLEVPGAG